VRKALAGDLADRTEVLYVSPLKALGNDIQKNLEIPLGEFSPWRANVALLLPEIRTAVRTAIVDARAPRHAETSAHILVTSRSRSTFCLRRDKSRAILRDVETVIVDEIPRWPTTSVERT